MAIPHKRRTRRTPPRTIPPTMAPPRPPPVETGILVGVDNELGDEGLRPNGQKSPPLGGTRQFKELPSLILTKFDEIDIKVVVLSSITNGAGLKTVFDVGQFGPRSPMNDELPKKLFSCTVKFVAEAMAIP